MGTYKVYDHHVINISFRQNLFKHSYINNNSLLTTREYARVSVKCTDLTRSIQTDKL